jgi:RNA polymerase sigma-70 factor (ECF subfamily)
VGGDAVTDEALVARFRETGDQSSFEVLVARHRDFVYRVVRRLVHDAEDAADLTQEVFVKAYFGLDQFQSRASFRTWLRRIAVNHCINHMTRRQEPERVLAVESDGLSQTPDNLELRLHVQACLAHLSVADRAALLLKYVEDLDHGEIAEMMGISVSASKMRVQRAKQRFLRAYHENA